ncbi:MAG: hypothetical protein JO023_18940 [Chloroflexi bacterium]|nr:hypothetical protein [Chloroflexota bacterium]
MGLVSREHDNMRAALGALLALGDASDGLAFSEALSGFWLSQGYLNEGEEWLRRFLASTATLMPESIAQGLYVAGRFAEYQGAFEAGKGYFSEGLRIADSAGSPRQSARALFGLASIAAHLGDYSHPYGCFQQGLSLGRDASILADVAEALAALARIETIQGDSIASRAHFEEAVAIQRQRGNAWGLAYVLNELGQQARDERDLPGAQALEEEAYTLWTRSGSQMGQRAALMNLTVIRFERNDLSRARELARQTLELSREIDDASATTVRCVKIASEVLQAIGAAETVVHLEAAANHQRQTLRVPLPPNERAERERTQRTAAEVLSIEAYERGWAEGGRLSIQEAAELAADQLQT